MLPLALLLLPALAGDRPALALDGRTWLVDPVTWDEGTARMDFRRGWAFEVTRDGETAGVVVVGEVAHTVLADDVDALHSRLAWEADVTDGLTPEGWMTTADAVIAFDPTLDDRVASWKVVTRERGGLWERLPDGTLSVLVLDHRTLDDARRAAARALDARLARLELHGAPLERLLDLAEGDPARDWSWVDARTAAPLERLGGTSSGRADGWVSTLRDDLWLDGGRRVATVSLGTRFVQRLSGG